MHSILDVVEKGQVDEAELTGRVLQPLHDFESHVQEVVADSCFKPLTALVSNAFAPIFELSAAMKTICLEAIDSGVDGLSLAASKVVGGLRAVCERLHAALDELADAIDAGLVEVGRALEASGRRLPPKFHGKDLAAAVLQWLAEQLGSEAAEAFTRLREHRPTFASAPASEMLDAAIDCFAKPLLDHLQHPLPRSRAPNAAGMHLQDFATRCQAAMDAEIARGAAAVRNACKDAFDIFEAPFRAASEALRARVDEMQDRVRGEIATHFGAFGDLLDAQLQQGLHAASEAATALRADLLEKLPPPLRDAIEVAGPEVRTNTAQAVRWWLETKGEYQRLEAEGGGCLRHGSDARHLGGQLRDAWRAAVTAAPAAAPSSDEAQGAGSSTARSGPRKRLVGCCGGAFGALTGLMLGAMLVEQFLWPDPCVPLPTLVLAPPAPLPMLGPPERHVGALFVSPPPPLSASPPPPPPPSPSPLARVPPPPSPASTAPPPERGDTGDDKAKHKRSPLLQAAQDAAAQAADFLQRAQLVWTSLLNLCCFV
eukprot:6220534-Prymnesium_polylepis.1